MLTWRQLTIGSMKNTKVLSILQTSVLFNVSKPFSSLSLNCTPKNSNFFPLLNTTIGHINKNSLSSSAALFMPAPTKKKRRNDPMVERQRDERKKKKLTKALRKMERKPRILKPLLELEVDPNIYGGEMKLKRERVLPVISAEAKEINDETHALLTKEWSRFAGKRHAKEIRLVDSVLLHRQQALEELRKESNDLYAEAIKPELGILDNDTRIFYKAVGPNSSPPIRKDFEDGQNKDWLIDGHYEEMSKKFVIQYGDTKSFMTRLLDTGRRKRVKNAKVEED